MENKTCKLIMLGASNVGKTSFITKFVTNKFVRTESTISVDYYKKTVEVNGSNVPLTIMDTAGQERFSCMVPAYYRNAEAAILIYDVTSRASYNQIEKYVTDFLRYCGMDPVSFEEVKSHAEEHGMLFFEVSAKTGQNVRDVFNDIAKYTDEKWKSVPKTVAAERSGGIQPFNVDRPK